MNFLEAIASGFRNYVGFSGRAARSEYWYWNLFVFLVNIATGILDVEVIGAYRSAPLTTIAGLLLFLPGLALHVRRLHDLDKRGWWFLLLFLVAGAVWFWRGTPGPNRFGQDPLGAKV